MTEGGGEASEGGTGPLAAKLMMLKIRALEILYAYEFGRAQGFEFRLREVEQEVRARETATLVGAVTECHRRYTGNPMKL